MVGTVAQRQVALLGEDLAGRGRLRAVGHLVGRDDGLLAFAVQTRTFLQQGRADDVRVMGLHPAMVRDAYTPWEYHEETTMAIEIDPVCGMSVDTSTSLLSFEHDGTTYWFCGKGCLLEFKDDPEKYLSPDHEPSM